jgi:hypothetical protein
MSKTVTITTTEAAHEMHGNRIDTVLTLPHRGYRKRFGLGFVPEGHEGRQSFMGEMVPGPWAYAFGLCSVIDNHGGTGAERQRNLAANLEHDVEAGDTVIINGNTYEVKVTKNGSEPYLKLV